MSSAVPKHVPVTAGVQPDAPHAGPPNDPDLVDGPPSIDDEVGLESAGGG